MFVRKPLLRSLAAAALGAAVLASPPLSAHPALSANTMIMQPIHAWHIPEEGAARVRLAQMTETSGAGGPGMGQGRMMKRRQMMRRQMMGGGMGPRGGMGGQGIPGGRGMMGQRMRQPGMMGQGGMGGGAGRQQRKAACREEARLINRPSRAQAARGVGMDRQAMMQSVRQCMMRGRG